MPFPPEFLRELDSRSPIADIASSYVDLKRRGKTLLGLCPFHNEKTPSFNIYPENNSFYCFGCNKGGGVFQFVMGVENLAFPDAVRWLAQRAGMTVPEDGVDDSMSRLRTRILEINREAGRFFYKTLSTPEGKAGLAYLRGRGLDPQTIRRFGLGYAPDSGFALVNHLKAKGYTQEEMTAADVARISQRGHPYDRYRGRVMFPIFDLRGNVVAFGGRVLTDEKPKYINTTDTPVYHKSSGLFAMNLAKDSGSRQLILAEGYMDVIALHRAGFSNAIASLGTSLTEEQARIIRRYADEAVICYDSDEAGQRATQRAIPILKNTGLRVRVITVPGNKDPDEFMKTYGAEGPLRFKQLLEAGGNDTEYRLEKIKAKYDLSTEDEKLRYLRDASENVLAKLDKMERDVYAGRLSQETGVGKDSILDTVGRLAAQENRKKKRELIRSQQQVTAARSALNTEKEKNLKAALAEESVIAFLFRHQDKARELREKLPPEKFVTDWNRRVYAILLGKTIYGDVSLTDFFEELTQDEVSELTRILTERSDAPPTWADVEEYMRIILHERGFSDPKKVQNASPEELKQYFDELRKQK
ncbi:DNA primase [Neglectibacter caecimuris]|uniref:DNA primase n=1 Tax=Neglectibacter caecimuris TaxID=3093658 RepID=UPI002AC8EDB8|nr:DNA primase [Neglectibacter sp. M00184]